MDSTTLTLIVALAGLTGTLIAPAIQAGIAARVEARRQLHEDVRHQSEYLQRLAELQFETKRTLFVRVLSLVDEYYEWLSKNSMLTTDEQLPGWDRTDSWDDEWRASQAEIQLLAPEVVDLLGEIHEALVQWHLSPDDILRRSIERSRSAKRAIVAAQAAMRESLGIVPNEMTLKVAEGKNNKQ